MTSFLIFLLGYTLSQFYRAFLAVIAPLLSAELDLGPDDLADMSAAFFLVFAFAQFPLGVALDRLGPRRTVPTLMLAAVAGAWTLANARTGLECVIANGLIGLGCSPIYMGALFVFARTEPPQRFGFLAASMLGFGSAGNLLAATPLSLAVEAFGWRHAFLGIAGITLASAAIIFIVLRDPPKVDRPDPTASGSMLSELAAVLRIAGLWPLIPLLILGYATVVVERGLWLGPYFAQVHGLGTEALGDAALAMAVSMSLGALFFGWLDRTPGRRKQLVMIGSCLACAGFLLLGSIAQPPLWLAVATIAFIGFFALSNPLLAAHARLFYPDHLIGRGITFANFLTIGGAGLLQWVSGQYVAALETSGLPAPQVFAALHLAFALAIALATAIYLFSRVPDLSKRPAR